MPGQRPQPAAALDDLALAAGAAALVELLADQGRDLVPLAVFLEVVSQEAEQALHQIGCRDGPSQGHVDQRPLEAVARRPPTGRPHHLVTQMINGLPTPDLAVARAHQ